MERREHFSAMSKLSEDCKISEAKELTREEKRQQKLLDRQKREQHEQKKKDAALRRASDLVLSNRVPIEITRGARVARAGKIFDTSFVCCSHQCHDTIHISLVFAKFIVW
jgi:hypothetical protein